MNTGAEAKDRGISARILDVAERLVQTRCFDGFIRRHTQRFGEPPTMLGPAHTGVRPRPTEVRQTTM